MKTVRLVKVVVVGATVVASAGLLAGLSASEVPDPSINKLAPVSVQAKSTLTPSLPKPRVNTSEGLTLHWAPRHRDPPIGSGRPTWQGDGRGPIYTWQDGDRTMRVVLQPDLTVRSAADHGPANRVLETRTGESIVRKRNRSVVSGLPVFRSETGNTLMTLPGGVLLVLDAEWDQHDIDRFFSDNQVDHHSVTEFDFLDNAFLVPTEPGFPSLELANRLVGLPGVVSSSPNWWRDRGRN